MLGAHDLFMGNEVVATFPYIESGRPEKATLDPATDCIAMDADHFGRPANLVTTLLVLLGLFDRPPERRHHLSEISPLFMP
jgi:hypothetical protein